MPLRPANVRYAALGTFSSCLPGCLRLLALACACLVVLSNLAQKRVAIGCAAILPQGALPCRLPPSQCGSQHPLPPSPRRPRLQLWMSRTH